MNVARCRPAAPGLPDRDRRTTAQTCKSRVTIGGAGIVRTFQIRSRKTAILLFSMESCSRSAVAKITGKEGLQFADRLASTTAKRRPPRDSGDKVRAGDVIVIRYEEGARMREMLSPTGALTGRGFGDKVALITDGRFSGGSMFSCRTCRPSRARWPMAFASQWGAITIDAQPGASKSIFRPAELKAPSRRLKPRAVRTHGVLVNMHVWSAAHHWARYRLVGKYEVMLSIALACNDSTPAQGL